MEAVLTFLFILGAFSGTKAEGLLPEGPLLKATGDSVLFSISKTPTETPFISVRWTFENREILVAVSSGINTSPEYIGRTNYFPSTGSLELRNLLSKDSGVYGVVIVSNTAVTESGSILLNIYDPVSGVTVTPTSGELVEGDTIILRCSSSGSSLSFLWMNGSTEVTTSDRVQLTDGNRNLTITSVTRHDQGLYRCQVSNPVSNSTSGTVNITVSYGPEDIQMTVSPNKLQHNVGSTINLKCSADSSPSPQFTWFMNNQELSSAGVELNLRDVTLNQTGNYRCRAFNPITGVHFASAPVSITVIDVTPPGEPACSAGCIAGIVIGCIVFVAALVGGGYFCFHKKKTNRKSTVKNNAVFNENHYENMQMPSPQNVNLSRPYYVNEDESHYENMPPAGNRRK